MRWARKCLRFFFGLSIFLALPMVVIKKAARYTWLEILGTAAWSRKWALVDTLYSVYPRGNPPSGVAVWYCLVDAVDLTGGPPHRQGLKNANGWLPSTGYYLERVGRLSDLLCFRGHVRTDIQTQTHRISQAISTSLKNPDFLPSSLSTKPKSTPHLDEAHPISQTRGLHRDGAQECLMFVTGQA